MKYVNSLDMFGVDAKEIPCIKDKGAPTTATEGAVGCFYMDTDTGAMYKCVAVQDGAYKWEPIVARDFATPEMFGAVGDGVNDDTAAVQAAINSRKPVVLSEATYLITQTLILPSGCKIEGSQNSVIKPTAETVFKLSEKNILRGFYVSIDSTNVLAVFHVDDTSVMGESILSDIIDGVTVYNNVVHTPDMYTVCHFHANQKGFYGITVKNCSFICNITGGYAVRAYSDGDGWLSTCTFENNITRCFKWHYFFANNDIDVYNTAGAMHGVHGCVGQCTPETNGFVYCAKELSCVLKHNTTWDWSLSESCKDTPYVFKEKYNQTYSNDVKYLSITLYDGITFRRVPANDINFLNEMGGVYPYILIPKFVGIGNKKCVRVYKRVASHSTNTRITFYLSDRYGMTRITINPTAKKAYVSPTLAYDVKIGTINWNDFYIYGSGTNTLRFETGILTLPVSNNLTGYSVDGNEQALNLIRTANIDRYADEEGAFYDSLPDGMIDVPVVTKNTTYITDDDGAVHQIYIDSTTGELAHKVVNRPEAEF